LADWVFSNLWLLPEAAACEANQQGPYKAEQRGANRRYGVDNGLSIPQGGIGRSPPSRARRIEGRTLVWRCARCKSLRQPAIWSSMGAGSPRSVSLSSWNSSTAMTAIATGKPIVAKPDRYLNYLVSRKRGTDAREHAAENFPFEVPR